MGRRPAFFIYLMIESIFSIATAYATSFYLWLACRIGVGFTVPAIMGTPYVMGNCYYSSAEESLLTNLLPSDATFASSSSRKQAIVRKSSLKAPFKYSHAIKESPKTIQ